MKKRIKKLIAKFELWRYKKGLDEAHYSDAVKADLDEVDEAVYDMIIYPHKYDLGHK
jgi:hypothetical protein